MYRFLGNIGSKMFPATYLLSGQIGFVIENPEFCIKIFTNARELAKEWKKKSSRKRTFRIIPFSRIIGRNIRIEYLNQGRSQRERGEITPPTKQKNIVIEKWCYFQGSMFRKIFSKNYKKFNFSIEFSPNIFKIFERFPTNNVFLRKARKSNACFVRFFENYAKIMHI